MSNVFLTSDLHWGHKWVSELRGYGSPEEMDEEMETIIRRQVGKRDVVWNLGDLAVSAPAKAIERTAGLPGTWHLVAGNHDRCHPQHKDAQTYQEEYLKGFASVQAFARRKWGGQEFLMSHYPYESDHVEGGARYLQYRLRDMGMPLIHGHTHDNARFSRSFRGTPQLHVGWDAWGRLVPLNELLELWGGPDL